VLRCALAALPDHWKSVASQWLPGGLPPSLGAPQAGTHCSHQKAASAFSIIVLLLFLILLEPANLF